MIIPIFKNSNFLPPKAKKVAKGQVKAGKKQHEPQKPALVEVKFDS
jgi:hypothetical protein